MPSLNWPVESVLLSCARCAGPYGFQNRTRPVCIVLCFRQITAPDVPCHSQKASRAASPKTSEKNNFKVIDYASAQRPVDMGVEVVHRDNNKTNKKHIYLV
jgi:hypothetical protein